MITKFSENSRALDELTHHYVKAYNDDVAICYAVSAAACAMAVMYGGTAEEVEFYRYKCAGGRARLLKEHWNRGEKVAAWSTERVDAVARMAIKRLLKIIEKN